MSVAASQTAPAAYALAFRDTMLQALAQEKATTAKVIAAIPDPKRDYRPDPKSRTAWELAWHIASEDVILTEQTAAGKYALPDTRYDSEQPKTSAELAAWYERRMSAAIDKVRAVSDEQLLQPVDFLGMFTWPLFMYLLLINNHSVHHRGQLSTYLRAMGSKVPSIYGPSADTQG
jgi:uncharacterized damage-inducible protein DinB